MRSFTKNSCLFDFAPELVKEWHPSANGLLTPRNVKIAHTKKVWWICGQSHEWQATIKSRLLGGKCPICTGSGRPTVKPDEGSKHSASNRDSAKDRTALRTPNTALESDGSEDNLGHDFRKSRRFAIRAIAVLEDPKSGHWFYADAKNFSAGGICFESEAPVVPGTRLIIKLDQPLFILSRMNFNSMIKWCRKLDNENEEKAISGYAMGAAFI